MSINQNPTFLVSNNSIGYKWTMGFVNWYQPVAGFIKIGSDKCIVNLPSRLTRHKIWTYTYGSPTPFAPCAASFNDTDYPTLSGSHGVKFLLEGVEKFLLPLPTPAPEFYTLTPNAYGGTVTQGIPSAGNPSFSFNIATYQLQSGSYDTIYEYAWNVTSFWPYLGRGPETINGQVHLREKLHIGLAGNYTHNGDPTNGNYPYPTSTAGRWGGYLTLGRPIEIETELDSYVVSIDRHNCKNDRWLINHSVVSTSTLPPTRDAAMWSLVIVLSC